MGMDYSYLAVVLTEEVYRLERTVCMDAPKGNEDTNDSGVNINGGSVILRVKINSDAMCTFSFSGDGRQFTDLGEPFKAREGRWIGAKVGVFAASFTQATQRGYADFDWFRFSK